MDAVEFIRERQRMCNAHKEECIGCPMNGEQCVVGFDVDAGRLVGAVEAWSAAHPRKTRQSVFLEQWPETRIDIYGVLCVCPDLLTSAYRGAKDGCATPTKRCADCRREFWMQEVE